MAKGVWHYVGAADDLLFLAAFYYGDMAAWTHIYYANVDLYGDDFEMIPAGSTVFIPDVDEGAVNVKLSGVKLAPTVAERCPAPGGAPFVTRQGPKKTSFDVISQPAGTRDILFHLSDGSDLLTGPRGVGYAAEQLETVEKNISNGRGGGASVAVKDEGQKGIPRSTARRKGYPHVVDCLRTAVEQHYGHAYMYFDVAAANDIDEDTVITAGTVVSLPTRFKRGPAVNAAKWRKRIGRRKS